MTSRETSLLLRESLDIFQSGGGRDARAREKFYSMHPLVRCLCLMKVEADEKMKRTFQSGLLSFTDECFQQLRVSTTVNLTKDTNLMYGKVKQICGVVNGYDRYDR